MKIITQLRKPTSPRNQIPKPRQTSPVTFYDKQSNRVKELGTTSILRPYMTACIQIPLSQIFGWDEFASELLVFAIK